RTGTRLHRAPWRPLRPHTWSPRRGAEDGGKPADRVRHPRGDARSRAIRRAGRGTADVSTNGDAGRLRSPTSPKEPDDEMGGGVLLRTRARPERTRRPRRSVIDVLTHPGLARLHPTFGHPESERRLEVLLAAFPEARDGPPAPSEALERV